MRKVGQLIELDPDKKYIMLLERNILTTEEMKYLADSLTAQSGNLVAITLPHFDCIEFVENSDRVFEVVEKKEDNQK